MSTNAEHDEKMLRLGHALKTGEKYASGAEVIWVLPDYRRPQPGEHTTVYWFPDKPLWTRFWVKDKVIHHVYLWANKYLYESEFKEYLEKEGIITRGVSYSITDYGWKTYISLKEGVLWLNTGQRDIIINSSLLEKLYASTTTTGS